MIGTTALVFGAAVMSTQQQRSTFTIGGGEDGGREFGRDDDDDGRNVVELHNSLGYDHAHAWMHVQGNARVTPVPERRVRRES